MAEKNTGTSMSKADSYSKRMVAVVTPQSLKRQGMHACGCQARRVNFTSELQEVHAEGLRLKAEIASTKADLRKCHHQNIKLAQQLDHMKSRASSASQAEALFTDLAGFCQADRQSLCSTCDKAELCKQAAHAGSMREELACSELELLQQTIYEEKQVAQNLIEETHLEQAYASSYVRHLQQNLHMKKDWIAGAESNWWSSYRESDALHGMQQQIKVGKQDLHRHVALRQSLEVTRGTVHQELVDYEEYERILIQRHMILQEAVESKCRENSSLATELCAKRCAYDALYHATDVIQQHAAIVPKRILLPTESSLQGHTPRVSASPKVEHSESISLQSGNMIQHSSSNISDELFEFHDTCHMMQILSKELEKLALEQEAAQEIMHDLATERNCEQNQVRSGIMTNAKLCAVIESNFGALHELGNCFAQCEMLEWAEAQQCHKVENDIEAAVETCEAHAMEGRARQTATTTEEAGFRQSQLEFEAFLAAEREHLSTELNVSRRYNRHLQ